MRISLLNSCGLFLVLTVRLLFAVTPFQLQKTENGYRFHLNLEDLQLQKEAVQAVTKEGLRVNETFVKAYVYGFDMEGAEGDPALCASDLEFAYSGDTPRVAVTDIVSQEIPLEGKLYPMQPSLPYTGAKNSYFAYNPASYTMQQGLTKKAVSPYVSVSQTYTYRGQKSATLTIRPFSYNLSSNTLTSIKEMTVSVEMDKPEVLHSWNSMEYDKLMRATYANLVDAAAEPFSAREKYLIITTPQFNNDVALKEFIDYRSRFYDVKVVSTGEVGGTTIDAYRSFIRGEKPAFCLLVGKQFPAWEKKEWKSFNYYVASQISSSSKKPQPDIALGLFYVDNATEIDHLVKKTIATEAGLSTRPKVILGQGGNNEVMDNLPKEHCDRIVQEVVSRYFPSNEGWIASVYTTSTPAEGARRAVELFNKGCWFNIYNGHGFLNRQEFGWGASDLSLMSNTIYPFILNCCCESGTFDRNCVAATSVVNAKGPVTVIAAYGTSYQGQHVLCRGYPEAIMDKKITKSGLAFMYAVNFDSVPRYYVNIAGIPSTWDKAMMGWQFHHFGDPAIETMICAPMVKVIAPKKSDKVEQEVAFPVSWVSNIKGKVTIDLYKGGKKHITLSTVTDAQNGIYHWTPTSDIVIGTDYQIRVTSVDSSDLYDTSSTFSIIPEYLLTPPYTQTFDTLDSGSTTLPFKYIQTSDTSDVLDWLVWKGPTPSRAGNSPDTGPEGDKTSGNGSYIYIEASGNSPDKKADFSTPCFKLNDGSFELSFWVHMYSSSKTMGSLSLDVCSDTIWKNKVLTISGDQGDTWVEQKFDCTDYAGKRVKFRFRGTTGSDRASDICIDDLRIKSTGKTATPIVASPVDLFTIAYAGSEIRYTIPEAGTIEPLQITLYTSQGRLVRNLFNGRAVPGTHLLAPGNLARGVYMVTMESGKLSTRNLFHYVK